ncbi:hypothetical protein DB811_10320 [Xanthomonas perforans]|uniref:Uncharacterized protein n=1 Tax=Xanthomonas perforans TaxID=442694 RepID=A0AAQ0YLN3_XANPE|nr:hypothetical protein DB854_10545 [Xanthomonas perforans]RXD40564.1 hypothetical protein DB761_18220 [Xanthomonas perforans]RXD42848.1 hypothetical protein DB757_07265 [Xanthomonas perforans]RXD48755.1 hypothetical protein DB768_11445 [Xanthomonas perforans]RXD51191.1 hypothetical protein DB769_17340 [Xanthomonas perforans]
MASCTAHERTTVYRVVGIRSVQHAALVAHRCAGDGTISSSGIKSLCTAVAQGVKPAQRH